MLIRYYFPKGTELNKASRKEKEKVKHELNERIRKTLILPSPKKVFEQEILNLSN